MYARTVNQTRVNINTYACHSWLLEWMTQHV